MISAVASRPPSDSAVQTVCLRFQRGGCAGVEIISYQFAGSGWAAVGRLFDRGRGQQEAAEIKESLAKRMKAP